MARATSEAVDQLHELAALTITEQIKRYRDGLVIGPDDKPMPVPPALLAQALKFLKDNGIDSPQRARKVLDTLKDEIPDFEFGDQPGGMAH